MTKKYISLRTLNLTTTILVKNTECVVEFRNGILTPKRIPGYFITDNPILQEALEQHHAFGTLYTLDKEYMTSTQTTSRVKTEINLKKIEDITTKQMAIEWLKDKTEQSLTRRSSIATIEQCANQLGYTFSNLK